VLQSSVAARNLQQLNSSLIHQVAGSNNWLAGQHSRRCTRRRCCGKVTHSKHAGCAHLGGVIFHPVRRVEQGQLPHELATTREAAGALIGLGSITRRHVRPFQSLLLPLRRSAARRCIIPPSASLLAAYWRHPCCCHHSGTLLARRSAMQILSEMADDLDRLCGVCDLATGEESYASLLATQQLWLPDPLPEHCWMGCLTAHRSAYGGVGASADVVSDGRHLGHSPCNPVMLKIPQFLSVRAASFTAASVHRSAYLSSMVEALRKLCQVLHPRHCCCCRRQSGEDPSASLLTTRQFWLPDPLPGRLFGLLTTHSCCLRWYGWALLPSGAWRAGRHLGQSPCNGLSCCSSRSSCLSSFPRTAGLLWDVAHRRTIPV
jgi:hypothetical protein